MISQDSPIGASWAIGRKEAAYAVELAEDDARNRAIKAFEEEICPFIDGEYSCKMDEECHRCEIKIDFLKVYDNI